MNDYPILQFFTFDHLPEHLADVSRPFADLAEVIAAETDGDPETEVALRKLLEADDPVEDAAALSYVWTLLQVEKQSRSQARSSADAYRRLAHDLLSLRDADPAAYRALMARLDADQGGNR